MCLGVISDLASCGFSLLVVGSTLRVFLRVLWFSPLTEKLKKIWLFGLPNFIFFLVSWVPVVCYISSKHKESYCYYCSQSLEFRMVQLRKQLPVLVMRLKNSCYSCKILWSWYCFSGCFNNNYLLIVLNRPYYSSKCNISLWCWTFRNWVKIYT